MIKWMQGIFKGKDKPVLKEGYTFIEVKDLFCATCAMYGAICLSNHVNDLGMISSGFQYTYYYTWLKYNDPNTASIVRSLIILLLESIGDKEHYTDEDIENAIADVVKSTKRQTTIKNVMSFYQHDLLDRFDKIRW